MDILQYILDILVTRKIWLLSFIKRSNNNTNFFSKYSSISSITQRCGPSITKCGWNDISRSFHLILVTPSDPLAGAKELENFLIFKDLFDLKLNIHTRTSRLTRFNLPKKVCLICILVPFFTKIRLFLGGMEKQHWLEKG